MARRLWLWLGSCQHTTHSAAAVQCNGGLSRMRRCPVESLADFLCPIQRPFLDFHPRRFHNGALEPTLQCFQRRRVTGDECFFLRVSIS